VTEQRTIAGRYELTECVGTGGMGKVWLAYDTRLDRQVALKLLRSDLSLTGTKGRSVVARFKREARFTARLEHPGVPAVFDAGADGDELYLVMQLIRGKDLGEVLAEQGALSVEWVAAIGAQIASVLASAHSVSLVHRDLKPRNVMLAAGGVVTVLDFGISALLDRDLTKVTINGETLGSPGYMAPEQLTTGQVSPLTDLYALGCMLYELLTGEQVFGRLNTMATMLAQVNQEPRPLTTLRMDVPSPLGRLVLDLLAKDPEQRPADAGEVYTRLLPFLPRPTADQAGEPELDSTDPTRPYRYPLAPRPRARPAPVVELLSATQVREVRARAADLAENDRFTQASELLADLLADAPTYDLAMRAVRGQYANTLLLGGDCMRALPEFRRLVIELTDSLGEDDQDVLFYRSQMATCLAELGEITEALREFQEVLDAQKRVRSHDDPMVLDLRRQIGMLFGASGDLHGARRVLTSLLADTVRIMGSEHPGTSELQALVDRLRQVSG